MNKRIIYILSGIIALVLGYGLFKGMRVFMRNRTSEAQTISQLKSLTSARINMNFKADQALVLRVKEGSKVIIIGTIQGDMRALASILEELSQKELIKNGELAPDIYLMFNGTMLGDSLNSSDVLMTILSLMKVNPRRILYLGNEPLGQVFSDKEPSYRQAFRSFYGTLPVGIYLFGSDLTKKPIRISPYGNKKFSHIACESVDLGNIKAICTIDARCSYPEGKLTGSIESAQGDSLGLGVHRIGNQFHLVSFVVDKHSGAENSVFGVLEVAALLAESELTVYAQSDSSRFKEYARYRFN